METGRKYASFGGMEIAFSHEAMLRYDAFFSSARGEPIRLPWKEPPSTTKETKESKKRKRFSRKNNRTWGLWATLPENLIVSIILLLNIVDYFAVGGVCRSWRSVVKAWRDYYMERQKPLLVVKSEYAKKSCFLYNIFDREEYKALLPAADSQCKSFVGLSCGYVITLNRNIGFWLINLMTRHELRFPLLPKDKNHFLDFGRSMLFKSTRLSRVFMILFLRSRTSLLLSEAGGDRWIVYTLPNTSFGIADVKVFKKKIYVLSVNSHICVFDPSAGVMKLPVAEIIIKERPWFSKHLLILENQLCMRTNHWTDYYQYEVLFQLDMAEMVWIKMKKLGKYSLFKDNWNATAVDASGWGAGNCICSVGFKHLADNICSFRVLNDKRLAQVPIFLNGNNRLTPYFWYVPSQSCTIDCVD